MSHYQRFAKIYDELMQDIPYELYSKRIAEFLGPQMSRTVVELGCGTGNLLEKLMSYPYQIEGVDISEEMLSIASTKFTEKKHHIPLTCMDIRDFDYPKQVDAFILAVDVVNYLLEEDEIASLFETLYQFLNEDGCVVFDSHTLQKMASLHEGSPYTFENENLAYIWYAEKNQQHDMVESDLTFFVKNEDDRLFHRFHETHIQRGYSTEFLTNVLLAVGFKIETVVTSLETMTFEENAERVYFFARK
ncbi:class I SAM-dependent DNA methyltransferase [Paenisporosarcina cavernae]|nr:class I SAM-dependent methyltransferase [Paenisporosarcina cavernae]